MSTTDRDSSGAKGEGTDGQTLVDGDASEAAGKPATKMPTRPSALKKLIAMLNLDLPTFLMMLKGALPPTMALAAYQSDAWAKEFTTLGYLVAIISTLSLPILPRAKFLQALTISVVGVCMAAAMGLLTIQCVVAARSPPPAVSSNATVSGASGSPQSPQYSSSASAVTCVWLFVMLYLTNAVRAARPQLFVASIQFAIYIVVVCTYAPSFPNMTAGMNFTQRLLKTFLTGHALATGVSLFILPVTSRTIAGKQMAGVLAKMKESLTVHGTYLNAVASERRDAPDDPDADPAAQQRDDAAQKLRTNLQQTSQLFGQLQIEIGFAKKEMGWGKLEPHHFSEVWFLLQQILLPIAGLSTFVDILQSVRRHKREGEGFVADHDTVETIRRLEAEERQEVVAMSREPFLKLQQTLKDALTHAAILLELVPRPKQAKTDVEKGPADTPVPGAPSFVAHLKASVAAFEDHRHVVIRQWCERKGIEVPTKFWEESASEYDFPGGDAMLAMVRHKHNQQQLYYILYLQYLVQSVCRAILNLVDYAESKVQDGTLTKKRFIFPGWRRLRKLIRSAFTQTDVDQVLQDGEVTGIFVQVGQSLSEARDPEHLPPSNVYEKITDHIRLIPKFLASDASAFGFRASVAAVSLAIIGYIRQTHGFYLAQRGIWAVVMVAISMGAHTGAGVQGFLARILGTAIAMVASIAIWYMADQKPAAILPLTYLLFACCWYVLLKKPKHLITAIITMVTVILIIGYELQDKKIGTRLLTQNGQQYYPIYLLAPYRLVSVCAGLAVAFIWTYFPYPITTHATLRKDLGATLYLMANYYSCTHSTVELRLRHGSMLDVKAKADAMHRLDKTRRGVFQKVMVMMNRLREHSAFTIYEPRFGGKFPKTTYDELIDHMQSLFNYMTITAYSTQAFGSPNGGDQSAWLDDFRRITADSRVTSQELTSTLCLLSASISNIQPLPPYIRVPHPIDIATQLGAIDPNILSIQHINEPCYAAFAVLEIAAVLIMQEMTGVLAKCKELVGEVDFSVHVIGSSNTSSSVFDAKGASGPKGKAD